MFNSRSFNLLEEYGSRLREHTVEVQINNQSGRYVLPDDEILRNKTVIGMYFWEGSDLYPPSGRPFADKNTQENSFITLMAGNVVLWDNTPYASFGIGDNDKSIRYFYLDDFTPSKSFILIDPAATITVGQSYVMTFIYLD